MKLSHLFKHAVHQGHPFLCIISLMSLSLLMGIIFQNCKFDDSNSSLKSSAVSYDRGSIIRINSQGQKIPEDHKIPADADVSLKFVHFHPNSHNFKWTIQRGFDFIQTDKATTEGMYQTQFSEKGTYDIFTSSHRAESTTTLTRASKRLVIGEPCVPTDVLEIVLISGSLTVGQTATFNIKNISDFSSISWKITLPSGKIINQNTESIAVDLASESAGLLIVEVSAFSSDPEKSECLTYRKQNFSVNDTSRVHFNPMVLKTKDSNEIAKFLENNEIYKYRRPQSSDSQQSIETHILNAHTCQFQVNNEEESALPCEGGLITITIDEKDMCYEKIITVWASNNANEEKLQQARQVYYNYCSKGGDYCYFGLLREKPGNHRCESSIATSSEGELPLEIDVIPIAGRCATAHNNCQMGSPQDIEDTNTHYKWQCVGTGGGETVNCQELKVPLNGDEACTSGSGTASCQEQEKSKQIAEKKSSPTNNPSARRPSPTHNPPARRPSPTNNPPTRRPSPTHSPPATNPPVKRSSCVDLYGSSCCRQRDGGTCTGQFCAEDCRSPNRCHVKDVNGICRPSCGHLANLQGSGGYGPDRKPGTADDPHTITSGTCSSLRRWGSSWEKIPLIEGKEPWEVIKRDNPSYGGECCRRATP